MQYRKISAHIILRWAFIDEKILPLIKSQSFRILFIYIYSVYRKISYGIGK